MSRIIDTETLIIEMRGVGYHTAADTIVHVTSLLGRRQADLEAAEAEIERLLSKFMELVLDHEAALRNVERKRELNDALVAECIRDKAQIARLTEAERCTFNDLGTARQDIVQLQAEIVRLREALEAIASSEVVWSPAGFAREILEGK